jgi:hypothetical protein
MQVTSLGFRTDLALRVLEGAEVTDRGDYTVVRSPDNPTFWWGNFLLSTSRWAWTPGTSRPGYRRSSWPRAWSSSAPPC